MPIGGSYSSERSNDAAQRPVSSPGPMSSDAAQDAAYKDQLNEPDAAEAISYGDPTQNLREGARRENAAPSGDRREPTPPPPKEKTPEEKKADADAEKEAAKALKRKNYNDSLEKHAGEVEAALKTGAGEVTSAGESYKAALSGLVEETKGLAKWSEGLVTSYEGIAGRYRKAFEEVEKVRDAEQRVAQRDYGANAALMSKAAAVGMGGQGPMTGAQQQLMMAGAQQQATSAYGTALDRISSMEMQRKTLGAQVVQGSMQQELSNRQAGYSMDAGSIQARATMEGGKYNADLTSIDARTNANTYGGTAGLSIDNAMNSYDLAREGLDITRETGAAQVNAMNNMPGVQGPGLGATLFSRGAAGAATGFAVGGPVGAGIGAGLGALSSLFF